MDNWKVCLGIIYHDSSSVSSFCPTKVCFTLFEVTLLEIVTFKSFLIFLGKRDFFFHYFSFPVQVFYIYLFVGVHVYVHVCACMHAHACVCVYRGCLCMWHVCTHAFGEYACVWECVCVWHCTHVEISDSFQELVLSYYSVGSGHLAQWQALSLTGPSQRLLGLSLLL